jgi:hypothetical protein
MLLVIRVELTRCEGKSDKNSYGDSFASLTNIQGLNCGFSKVRVLFMNLFILLCFESRGLSVKMLALELTGINQGMRV